MRVGELYNTDRYGLVLVLYIAPIYRTPSDEQVYSVQVLIPNTGRKTHGEFTQSDWKRMCA